MDIMSDGPVLVLSGDLDVRSTMQVRAAVQDLLGIYDEVAVDLSGVDSADVTALRVLAAATVQAVRDGHHLTLREPSPPVRRMLLLSHLARIVEVAPRQRRWCRITHTGGQLPSGSVRPTLGG